MIKLTSCDSDGGDNARPIWVNPNHIIGVEVDDRLTLLWLSEGMRVYVLDSVDAVIDAIRGAT